KGEIPSDDSGGIQYSVRQNDEHVRVGLIKSNTANPANHYFDYGIYTFTENGTSKIQLIVGSTSTYNNGQNYGTYQIGDAFKVAREQDGNIRFYHGSTVIETISATDEPLVGKVAFTGPSSTGINNLNLVGPNIDKKLQNVDYKYNIRGWLTDINDVHDTNPKSTDLFNFKINYNQLFGVNYGSTIEPLYNGNISETIWKTKNTDKTKRGYGYWYDDLNRIRRASNRAGENLENIDVNYTFTLWNVTYDQNGNIQKLRRQGYLTSQLYDDLDYSYSGNQLIEVTELSPCNCNEEGFKDDSDSGDPSTLADYQYDVNGNMISDRNKNIDLITYNHLNLPLSVLITGNQSGENGQIHYVYAANGVKMEKTLIPANGLVQITQYDGKFIYLQSNFGDTILQFISHPEGYTIPTPVIPVNGGDSNSVTGFDTGTGQTTYSEYQYVFQYKDHLGNVRLSYSDSNLDGAVNTSEIIEESNYYPFGLKQKGYNNDVSPNGNSLAQQWKFGGKELSSELGLETYDFGARNYDAALGRWMNLDPLAEQMRRHSPYNYAFDNPIYFIDYDGMMPEGSCCGGFKQWLTKQSAKVTKAIVKGYNKLIDGDSSSRSSSSSSSRNNSSREKGNGNGYEFGTEDGEPAGDSSLVVETTGNAEKKDVTGVMALTVVAGGKKSSKGNAMTNGKNLSKKNVANAFADGVDAVSDVSNAVDNVGSIDSSNTSGEVSVNVNIVKEDSRMYISSQNGNSTTYSYEREDTVVNANDENRVRELSQSRRERKLDSLINSRINN
ncbi:MAG: hypothetical protein JKY22_09110, partial [Flavobacteriaceae bacterium]|nr:hypothetical protein [Flavobacteriaceae bacterium]